jgi:hypothetical protein
MQYAEVTEAVQEIDPALSAAVHSGLDPMTGIRRRWLVVLGSPFSECRGCGGDVPAPDPTVIVRLNDRAHPVIARFTHPCGARVDVAWEVSQLNDYAFTADRARELAHAAAVSLEDLRRLERQ